METYTLIRTGDRPLQFDGELIAEQDTRHQDHNRWHELELYRTEAGTLVCRVTYRTQWQGEQDEYSEVLTGDAEVLTIELKTFDPCAQVIGFPQTTPKLQAKQDRLLTDLRQRFDVAIGALLAEVEPEVIQ